MVTTNIDMPPQKRAWGITIDNAGSNAQKKGRQELPSGDKGKGKCSISVRVITRSQATLFKPEDDQPVPS